jgi:hypothetical protein
MPRQVRSVVIVSCSTHPEGRRSALWRRVDGALVVTRDVIEMAVIGIQPLMARPRALTYRLKLNVYPDSMLQQHSLFFERCFYSTSS